MALLGTAALAMWWDMEPAMRGEFEHWHSHEHFPERLAIPGFLRASRWGAADGGPVLTGAAAGPVHALHSLLLTMVPPDVA